MKNMMMILICLTLQTAFAGEPSLIVERQATLEKVELDPALEIKTAYHGNLLVSDKQVNLAVYGPFPCPEGAVCPAVLVEVLEVSLPIVSVVQDDCGTTVITAEIDDTPRDLARQTLVVRDHSTRTCDDVQLFGTEVEYQTYFMTRGRPSPVQTRSYLAGSILQ